MQNEEKKVYIVTSGSYSAYGIRAVFSTREAADEYCKNHNAGNKYSDEADVEVWPLNAELQARWLDIFHTSIEIESGNLTGGWFDRDFVNPANVKAEPREYTIIGRARSIAVKSPYSQEHANKLAVEARQHYLRTGSLEGM